LLIKNYNGFDLVQIIHFYGKFVFQMPEYDNNASNDATKDPDAKFEPEPKKDIRDICGCDPEHYFEFIFRNVKVTQVTYRDGTSAINGDSIIGQRILMNGLMPDVSPSAICAQIFAGSLKVGNLLSGTLRKAIQSDLRTNLRPLDSPITFSSETAGAHFETILEITDKTSPKESRFLQELGDTDQLEFYMHLNQYTLWNTDEGRVQDRLSGNVYGYIRSTIPSVNNSGLRAKGRRIVADPNINDNSEVRKIFLGTALLKRNQDIDSTFDSVEDDRFLLLRYLDFIPFLDRCYNTPTDKGIIKEYVVFLAQKGSEELVEVGRFKGNYKEMQQTGGILVFQTPIEIADRADLKLKIKAMYKDIVVPLMVESDWDIVLENDRGITIRSKDTLDVYARVYNLNQPASNCLVRLLVQPTGELPFLSNWNKRSPIVATWKKENGYALDSDSNPYSKGLILKTDTEGRVKGTIQALDLEHSSKVFDPVKNQYVEGDLDWDRYYGNYVYMEIDNDLRKFQYRHVEQIEIAVRVLHVVENPESIPITGLTFKDYIYPKLLKYYVRYFPWLHVFEKEDQYNQFLDLAKYKAETEDETPGVFDAVDDMITRLKLDDNNWYKMPRSRDFPFGGAELLTYWKDKNKP
jgi:hypothetical protein